MYIPQIKDKHPLIDLARYGTKSRKSIHPDLLVGEHCGYPLFREGDILDGNATLNLIQCAYDQDRVYRMLTKEMQEFEANVRETVGSINDGYEEMHQKYEELAQETERLSNELQQAKEQHAQDIQDTRLYIDNKIDRLNIRAVYDDPEENLFVILDK